jgi:hypothetical protein
LHAGRRPERFEEKLHDFSGSKAREKSQVISSFQLKREMIYGVFQVAFIETDDQRLFCGNMEAAPFPVSRAARKRISPAPLNH